MKEKRHRFTKRYPELALFPDRASAENAWKECSKEMTRSPAWLVGVAGIVAAPLLVGRLQGFVSRWLQLPPILSSVLIGAVVGGCVGLMLASQYKKKTQRFLRRKLLEHGVPVCIPCGYDLRGQTEARCPECGEPFDPALIQVDQSDSA